MMKFGLVLLFSLISSLGLWAQSSKTALWMTTPAGMEAEQINRFASVELTEFDSDEESSEICSRRLAQPVMNAVAHMLKLPSSFSGQFEVELSGDSNTSTTIYSFDNNGSEIQVSANIDIYFDAESNQIQCTFINDLGTEIVLHDDSSILLYSVGEITKQDLSGEIFKLTDLFIK